MLFRRRSQAGSAKGPVVETNPGISAPPGSRPAFRGTLSAPPSGHTSEPSNYKPFDGRGSSAPVSPKTAKPRMMPGAPKSSGLHTQGNPGIAEARS